MTQSVNVAQFAFATEYLLRPFPRKAKGSGERAEEFNDLGDVIVVLAIFGARLRVEEVIACD